MDELRATHQALARELDWQRRDAVMRRGCDPEDKNVRRPAAGLLQKEAEWFELHEGKAMVDLKHHVSYNNSKAATSFPVGRRGPVIKDWQFT